MKNYRIEGNKLISYNTIVAIISKVEATIYPVKWRAGDITHSATANKHINEVARMNHLTIDSRFACLTTQP